MKRLPHIRIRPLPPPSGGVAPIRRPRRGIVLILTLWLSIIMSLMAISLAYEMRMEMRLTQLRRDGFVAAQIARVGVARAIADLKNDIIMDYAPDETNPQGQPFDGPGDIWRLEEDLTDIEVGDYGRFSVRVEDQESRLYLNTRFPSQVQIFKYALMLLDLRESRAEELAEALFDWIDPDDRPIGGEGETEIEYYGEWLARETGSRFDPDQPLAQPKNDIFLTMEELLMVPGMTPELLYGFDPGDPKAVRERQERLARGREVALGFADIFTLNNAGWLNANTASEPALTALFSTILRNPTEGRRRAAEILRATGRGMSDRTPNNDRALKSVQEIQLALGAEGQLMAGAGQTYSGVGVRSVYFQIDAEGVLLDDRGRESMRRRVSVRVGREWKSFYYDDQFEDQRGRANRLDRLDHLLDRARSDSNDIGSISIPVVRAMTWNEN